jgi:hypothetical protein
MTEQKLTELLDSYSWYWLGKSNHKYKVFNLENKNNSTLVEILEEEGYWVFAPNRSRKLVSWHQIANFFKVGKHLPAGEGDRLITHHLSGNIGDNSWKNLVYLTELEHELVSKYQRKLSKLKVKKFYKLEKNVSLTERSRYNSQGKPIRNWTKFILGVICVTVARSLTWVNYTQRTNKILQPIKTIVNFVERYLKKINWLPTLEEAYLANLY